MSTKSTKNNKHLSYPCIVEIKMAMGSKRKSEVIRAIDRVTGEDRSKMIVYPTLRNAFYAGVDLVKESIDSKWVRIEKKDAEARQVITNEGLVDHIAEAPAPAPAAAKPAKVHKPAKAATPVLGAPTTSKKAKSSTTPTAMAKASKAAKATTKKAAVVADEPTEDELMAIEHELESEGMDAFMFEDNQ